MLKISRFVFNSISVNTYLIYNENKECIIIDPGCFDEFENEKIVSFIEANSLKIKELMFTHGHTDHNIGAYFLHEKYGVPLAAHLDDKEFFKNSWMLAVAIGWDFDMDKTIVPSIDLHEGDFVALGEDKLRVISTPGHSPGGVCFYCEEGGFMFTGDTLFFGSYGRYDFPGGDKNLLRQSLQKLFTMPEDIVCYPGHGEPTTIGQEKYRGLVEELY